MCKLNFAQCSFVSSTPRDAVPRDAMLTISIFPISNLDICCYWFIVTDSTLRISLQQFEFFMLPSSNLRIISEYSLFDFAQCRKFPWYKFFYDRALHVHKYLQISSSRWQISWARSVFFLCLTVVPGSFRICLHFENESSDTTILSLCLWKQWQRVNLPSAHRKKNIVLLSCMLCGLHAAN